MVLTIGASAFIRINLTGLTIDGLQGLLYMGAALFALASSLQGEEEAIRYSKIAGWVFAAFALIGLLTPGTGVLILFRADIIENLFHVVIAGGLLYLGYEPRIAWIRWFSFKRLA
jgi:hypothetical protein